MKSIQLIGTESTTLNLGEQKPTAGAPTKHFRFPICCILKLQHAKSDWAENRAQVLHLLPHNNYRMDEWEIRPHYRQTSCIVISLSKIRDREWS